MVKYKEGVLNFTITNAMPTTGNAVLFGLNVAEGFVPDNDPDFYTTVKTWFRGSQEIALECQGLLVYFINTTIEETDTLYIFNDITITITIEGTTYSVQQIIATFGNPFYLYNYSCVPACPLNIITPVPATTPGCSPGITIVPDFNVPYNQVLMDTSPSPFTMKTIRIQSTNLAQLNENVTFSETNLYGETYYSPFSVDSQVSGFQYEKTIVVFDKKFHVTPNTYISIPVLGNTTMNFTVFVAERFNFARSLHKLKNMTSFAQWRDPIKPIKKLRLT